MTREQLEKYHDITVRLKELTSIIVTDSVKGSSPDYPYTSHSVTIHGVARDDKTQREIKRLEQKKDEIESFIDRITDIREKTIAELRIKQNCKWPQVGQHMGESPDAVRMCYYKIFSK